MPSLEAAQAQELILVTHERQRAIAPLQVGKPQSRLGQEGKAVVRRCSAPRRTVTHLSPKQLHAAARSIELAHLGQATVASAAAIRWQRTYAGERVVEEVKVAEAHQAVTDE